MSSRQVAAPVSVSAVATRYYPHFPPFSPIIVFLICRLSPGAWECISVFDVSALSIVIFRSVEKLVQPRWTLKANRYDDIGMFRNGGSRHASECSFPG